MNDKATIVGYCREDVDLYIPNKISHLNQEYSVDSIGDYAFSGFSSLTIYCEATSKQSGWSSYWNPSNRPVVWGYNAE